MAGWRDTIKETPSKSWRSTVREVPSEAPASDSSQDAPSTPGNGGETYGPPEPSDKQLFFSGPEGVKASMDKLSREMGYKNARDQSDKIGQGVMGGQVAGLAGPAMSTLSKLFGRGAAAAAPEVATAGAEAAAPAVESAAPEVGGAFRVSNAGPIKNLPKPGSALFDSLPAEPAAPAAQEAPGVGKAALDAMKESLKNQANVPVSEQIQEGIKHLAQKHPLLSLAVGGRALGGDEIPGTIHEAMKHPEIAATIAALGLGGPMVPVASGALGGEIGREAVMNAIRKRRGQRR